LKLAAIVSKAIIVALKAAIADDSAPIIVIALCGEIDWYTVTAMDCLWKMSWSCLFGDWRWNALAIAIKDGEDDNLEAIQRDWVLSEYYYHR